MSDLPNTQTLASDTHNLFTAVPIEITVSVGRARPIIRDLVMLGSNAVLTLDKRVDDPVDLLVGNKLIARGKLEEADGDDDGQLVVRLTEIIDLGSSI